MKQARTYEAKVRKLLAKMPKTGQKGSPDEADPIRTMVEAVFQSNTSSAKASKAIRAIEKEYVDFNELRVSPVKDIVECVALAQPIAKLIGFRFQLIIGERLVLLRVFVNGLDYRFDFPNVTVVLRPKDLFKCSFNE